MLKTYFKTAWRNLMKSKAFSFINIIGLSIGLTCFILIAIFVHDELNYDRYVADAKDIYRVNLNVTGNGDIAVYPNVDFAVGEGMKNAFPEIKILQECLLLQILYNTIISSLKKTGLLLQMQISCKCSLYH